MNAEHFDHDLRTCREQLAQGSRTFLAASWLLPRRVRAPACALYAFCRLADDAVDNAPHDPHTVPRLRERLERLYRGDPLPVAADRALAIVVQRHAIPIALPMALIDGFAWDAQGRHYDRIDELEDYAARVAGTVGAMMSLLMGVRGAAPLARACDLGVAMQLSNIARDIGEDARNGRLYLPREWMHEAGIDPVRWLAAPVFDARLAGVVQRLLRHADALYARVDGGVAMLPLVCRPSINAARYLYADIGHEVERRGLDSVSQRAVVSARRKSLLLARALVALAPSAAQAEQAPLRATQYLVDAAAAASAGADSNAVRAQAQSKAVWVIDLFERLERRDRLQRAI